MYCIENKRQTLDDEEETASLKIPYGQPRSVCSLHTIYKEQKVLVIMRLTPSWILSQNHRLCSTGNIQFHSIGDYYVTFKTISPNKYTFLRLAQGEYAGMQNGG